MSNKRQSELKDILESLGLQDAKIEMTNNGHYKITSDKLERQVITGSTPSDRRANLNLASELRKNIKEGIAIPRKLNRYSDEDKKIILKEAQETSSKAVMDKYKLSGSQLHNWRVRFGMASARKGIHIAREPFILAAIADVEKGMPVIKAAKKHGVGKQTIYGRIAKDKLDSKKSPAQPEFIKSKSKGEHKAAKEKEKQNDYKASLKMLGSMIDEIEDLRKENEDLKSLCEEYKAKLEIVSEAVKL